MKALSSASKKLWTYTNLKAIDCKYFVVQQLSKLPYSQYGKQRETTTYTFTHTHTKISIDAYVHTHAHIYTHIHTSMHIYPD